MGGERTYLLKKALRSASGSEIFKPKIEAREETALRGSRSSSKADRDFFKRYVHSPSLRAKIPSSPAMRMQRIVIVPAIYLLSALTKN